MADIKKSLEKLYTFEFSNNPEKFLHKNVGENGYTIGGVYEKHNKNLDWAFVYGITELCRNDIKRASALLFSDKHIKRQVEEIFKKNYFDPLQLDKIENQHISDEIFCFSVLCGVQTGAKLTQKCIGVKEDGIIGNVSLYHLNNFDADNFDKRFDELEVEHFESLVEKNPRLERYLNGWKNRSLAL